MALAIYKEPVDDEARNKRGRYPLVWYQLRIKRYNRALEAAFRRAGITDVSSHNLRKTFATRLLSRSAAITDVQHLLGHASVNTAEKAYAAFVRNEGFEQTIDLLDQPVQPKLKVVSVIESLKVRGDGKAV
jgi:integrase